MIDLGALRRSGEGVWRDFATFMLRPTLDLGDAKPVSRTATTVWLLVFSLGATALFALLAMPLVLLSSAAPGDALQTVLDRPSVEMILAIVVLGPLVEEGMFRGWLTGTLPAIAASVFFLTAWFGGSWLMADQLPRAASLAALSVLGAAGLLALVAADRKAKRSVPPGWYRAIFPLLFWAQGLAFGGLHIANLSSGSAILPWLMAASLAMCGWLWGYARIKLGFGTACLLHMTYNIPAAVAAMAFAA